MSQRGIKKILVVDDESSLTKFLHLVLTKDGYEVATAKDGREGLRQQFSVKVKNIIGI